MSQPVCCVEVIGFGCRLNSLESDAVRQAAEAAPRARDLIVFNTCAVTMEAGRQARQSIRRAARAKPDAEIVVTGCGAQVAAQDYAAMPEVSRVVGNVEKLRPEQWLAQPAAPRVAVGDIMAAQGPLQPLPVSERAARTRGFVQVQTGCDHRCTFCIIPFGRGASRSASADDIIARVRTHVETGVSDVVLTGVDITAFEGGLGALLRKILCAVPELPRLRLSSIDCIEAGADLVAAFAEEPRLMPHLHLSLQSGDDLILKRMRRRHTRQQAIAFCAQLRAARPEMVFGADLIAGFPTETEAHFEGTRALTHECGLTHLHIFPYSSRPGTPAARMPQVAAHVAHARAALLRSDGQAALIAHLEAQRHRRLTVLTERGGLGRTEDFTQIRTGAAEPGQMLTLQVTGHDGRVLAGEPLEAANAFAP